MEGKNGKKTEKKRLKKKKKGKKKKKKKKRERKEGKKKVERSLQAVGTSPVNDATYARAYMCIDYLNGSFLCAAATYGPRSPLASFTSLLLMTTLRAGFRAGRYSRIIYGKYLSKIIVRTKSVFNCTATGYPDNGSAFVYIIIICRKYEGVTMPPMFASSHLFEVVFAITTPFD